MGNEGVSTIERLDNGASGVLVGLLAAAAQAAFFLMVDEVNPGHAAAAIIGPLAAASVLALALWSRGARWCAAWTLAASLGWAYVALQLAMFGRL